MLRLAHFLPLAFCAFTQTALAQTAPDQTAPDQTAPEQTAPEQTAPLQAAPAQTAPDLALSAEIGASGIAATAARLAALPTPTAEEAFALGALRFLGAIEDAVQLRWRVGISDSMQMLPVLRLPIPENPAPAPFEPAMVSSLFTGIAAGMDSARASLAKLPPEADFGLEIALSDLWFDIDANGLRNSGEDLSEIVGPALLGWRWMERDTATPLPVLRFDAADAAWLSAYTHLLSGVAQTVLAYDPTEAITRVQDARRQLEQFSASRSDDSYLDRSFGNFADSFAMIAEALNQQPDPAFALGAQDHFLSMIAENRRFWALVERETDDTREWIPNDRQHSALGIELPQGAGAAWLSVLADAEALLKGELLAPYWRAGDKAGVNVARMFTDPRPIELIGWVQGWRALPYLEKGPIVTRQNLRRIEQMMSGSSTMFMVLVN